MLDEYCTLFYSPAAKAMKDAITYAEQNLAFKDQSRGRGRGNPAGAPLAVRLRLRVCHEPDMKNLSTRSDVHNGDDVVVSPETALHSYYHLEINPEADLLDGNPGPNWNCPPTAASLSPSSGSRHEAGPDPVRKVNDDSIL